MIKAQEAYQKTLEKLDEINIADILIAVDKGIMEAVEKGSLVAFIYPIEDTKAAEKAAIELRDNYGYNVLVTEAPKPIQLEGGGYKYACALRVDWLYRPANCRDKFDN